MSMILISGGSGSGKSEYAEGRAVRLHKESGGALYYAATMMIYDEESRRRVERHRKMREGKGFATVEIPMHIASLPVAAGDAVLVECLSNLLANEMYEPAGTGRWLCLCYYRRDSAAEMHGRESCDCDKRGIFGRRAL